ncbi:uncharacterized protein [Anas platyrhynchos]|uniref:uncharacterized protein n=1 Tax=Anas platyrhynchos TaxID=8839 RepID=UPI003AF2E32A
MAADGNSSDNEINEIKQEPLPEDTSYGFAPDELFEPSDSPSPEPLGQDEGAACDARAASTRGEKDPQALTDDRETKHVPHNSSEENAGNGNVFSSLSFPKKLWQVAESDEFKAIWWGHSGNYIVIDEEMFKVEVLGRTRPRRVFETESMTGFIRQLNLYGFTKLQQDLQRSPSLPDLPKEEDAFSACRKILYYYNPSFKRDSPHLLQNCKRRVALKRKALQAGLDESCPSSSLYAQPGCRDAIWMRRTRWQQQLQQKPHSQRHPRGPQSPGTGQKPPLKPAVPLQPRRELLPPCHILLQQQAGTSSGIWTPPCC